MKKTGLERNKKYNILIGILIFCVFAVCLLGVLAMGDCFLSSITAKVKVNTDIDKYQLYSGKNADEEYINKWDMDESIFPQAITEKMNVKDYKMVYYNPWDAQYLSYLVVQYDTKSYEDEVERLEAFPSTEYIGYYGVQGFDNQYELLAMNADPYQGFVYALTDKEDTIVYVEIIFCNYAMDMEYKKYIDEDLLPIGFDATYENPYEQKIWEQ